VDPKPLDSTLVAVADRPGRVILFARVGREVQFKQWLSGSGWGAWTSWGPLAPPPPPAPPPPDGLAQLVAGVRCTPPGGRLRVSLKIRKREGRRKPYVRRLLLHFPAGKRGRVYARAFYTRKARASCAAAPSGATSRCAARRRPLCPTGRRVVHAGIRSRYRATFREAET
jgi:hypothetical protein